jgi:Putative regulator of cell autolysis
MKKEQNSWFELLFINPKLRVVRHALLQTLIITLTIIAMGFPNPTLRNNWLLIGIIYYATMNLLIYLNIYIFTPKLLLKSYFGKYILLILASVIVYFLVILLMMDIRYGLVNFVASGIKNFFMAISLLCMNFGILLFATSTLALFSKWIKEQKRVSELKIATTQSELTMLKQQINPHFLFNTINNAHVLLKKNPGESSQVLFKLEELLNYQFNESAKEFGHLDTDINFINDFMSLEKIRRDHFDYSVTVEGNTSDMMIPPLLFIPFVENAVKHSPDNEKESYVHISFRITDNELCFRCENTKPEVVAVKSKVGGLGLKNISRRLELLYPNRHTLLITNDEQKFIVTLTINHRPLIRVC